MKPFALSGGVDQITPRALVPPGSLQDCYTYEVGTEFGYSSIEGFEVFDGRMSPSVRDICDMTVANVSIILAYMNKSAVVSVQDASCTGLMFSSDGTTMYMLGSTVDAVYQYHLSTPWDASTANYATKTYVISEDTDCRSLEFSGDGTCVNGC